MNYIERLRADNEALQVRIQSALDAVAEFRAHLQSPKFQPCPADTDRRDWISTADVGARLAGIVSALHGDA